MGLVSLRMLSLRTSPQKLLNILELIMFCLFSLCHAVLPGSLLKMSRFRLCSGARPENVRILRYPFKADSAPLKDELTKYAEVHELISIMSWMVPGSFL